MGDAAELSPGNRKIVHHAHVFVVDPEAPTTKKAPDSRAGIHPWLQMKEGTLSFIRPDAPVIDDGCLQDDNGASRHNRPIWET